MINLDLDTPSNLGPCCACGKEGEMVRNVMMLNMRAPEPGKGWGCFECDLPADGAIAVLCDECMQSDEPSMTYVCAGYPSEGRRVAISAYDGGYFGHDFYKHSEIMQWLEGCSA